MKNIKISWMLIMADDPTMEPPNTVQGTYETTLATKIEVPRNGVSPSTRKA